MRKRKGQTVSVRIPEYLHMELVEISKKSGISIIDMIEVALNDYLGCQEDVKRDEERRSEGE